MPTEPANAKKGKIPTWVYLAGGGVVALIVLLRPKGDNGPVASGAGLASSEIAQLLSEERQATSGQFSDIIERFKSERQATNEQLIASRADLGVALSESKAQQTATLNEALREQSQSTGGLIDALKAQIGELQAKLAELAGKAPTAGDFATGTSRPTGQQIADWANGIGLPIDFGTAFVSTFGRLPSSIAELESWRPYIAAQNSRGQWCILPSGSCV